MGGKGAVRTAPAPHTERKGMMALLAARDEAELNEQSGIGEKNQQAEMREVLLPSIFGAITAVSERLARLEVKLDEKGRDRMAGFYGSGHTTFNKKHAEQLAAYESSKTGGATLVRGTGKLALETRYFV